MKKQIVISALIGALVAAGGMLWEQPSFGATPDLQAAFSRVTVGTRVLC